MPAWPEFLDGLLKLILLIIGIGVSFCILGVIVTLTTKLLDRIDS